MTLRRTGARADSFQRPVPLARLSGARLADRESIEMWPGRYVEAGGTRLFVRSTPALTHGAEPALLVHGLGGAATNWTDFAALLRNHIASEALDLPGFGRSDPPVGEDYRLEAHARAVIDYLERSDRGPVHLVGNSMGGAVSILVAAWRPELLRTLTLVSPAVPDPNRLRAHALRGDPRLALLVLPGVGDLAMRRVAGVSPETRARATVALVFADKSRYPRRRMEEAIAEAQAREELPWANAAFVRSLRDLARSQILTVGTAWSAIRSIPVPTLVVWGDKDRLVSAALAPRVAGAIVDSRLLVLEDVGHTAMMEDPDTTARAFLGLVEDTARRSEPVPPA